MKKKTAHSTDENKKQKKTNKQTNVNKKKKVNTGSKRYVRRPGIEPGSTAWKAAMLTTIPPTLDMRALVMIKFHVFRFIHFQPRPQGLLGGQNGGLEKTLANSALK